MLSIVKDKLFLTISFFHSRKTKETTCIFRLSRTLLNNCILCNLMQFVSQGFFYVACQGSWLFCVLFVGMTWSNTLKFYDIVSNLKEGFLEMAKVDLVTSAKFNIWLISCWLRKSFQQSKFIIPTERSTMIEQGFRYLLEIVITWNSDICVYFFSRMMVQKILFIRDMLSLQM